MMEACSPGAPGAVEMTLMDLPDPSKLLEPILCVVRSPSSATRPHPRAWVGG